LRQQLKVNEYQGFALGWGFVVSFEFDFIVFGSIWVIITLLISFSLSLGLFLAPNSPAYRQVGPAIEAFMAPITIIGIVAGFICNYAKHRRYLR
jgi:putative flippase GtrA